MTSSLAFHATSHPGLVHTTNEDSFAVREMNDGGTLLLVCDGMGGMGQGDVASRLAVEHILGHLEGGHGDPTERMRDAIVNTDRIIREKLCNQGQGLPGSTTVMAYVRSGVAHVSWVGDSRAYWLRTGDVVERTRDHKLIDEFIEHGDMTEEEAKKSPMAHVITRALGGKSVREPSVRPATMRGWSLKYGDDLVLCSDGVCDLLSDAEVAELLHDSDIKDSAEAIVQLALDRGGHDNITVICARWEGEDAARLPPLSATPLLLSNRTEGNADDTVGSDRTYLVGGIVLILLFLFIWFFS